MIAMVELPPGPSVTDGEIAVINLESASRSEWARFTHDARLPGVAEAVIDLERLTLQFLGDLDALDRVSRGDSPPSRCWRRSSAGCRDRTSGTVPTVLCNFVMDNHIQNV